MWVQGTAVRPTSGAVSSNLQRLRTQATRDTRTGLNAGSPWVPQSSPKQPGTVDDEIVWDHED